jgi:hypothetical protein
VSNVFGVPFESLIVRVPFALDAPSVTIGVVFERVSGDAPDNVTVPLAAIVVAPATAPVFVIPPLLLLIPPVIDAPPPDTVSAPAEVIVPVPVVEILPDVERTPFSLIVSLLTPPDCMSRDVFVAAFVSLITNAVAVPSLVSVSEVDSPVPNVKSIFRPIVVVIVLPTS